MSSPQKPDNAATSAPGSRAVSRWFHCLLFVSGGLALVGIASLVLEGLGNWHGGAQGKSWRELGAGTLIVFLFGCIIFMWGANVIIPIRPKR